jgi:hypothetical protein
LSEGNHSRVSPTWNLDGLRAITTDQILRTIAALTITTAIEGTTVESSINTARVKVRTRTKVRIRARVRVIITTIGVAVQVREGSRGAVYSRISLKGRGKAMTVVTTIDREATKMIGTRIAMTGVVVVVVVTGMSTTGIVSTV